MILRLPFRPAAPRQDPSRRPLAVEVLDGGLVAPDDLVARQAEDAGDAVALLRAGRPPAEHDRQDARLVHARLLGKLPHVEAAGGTELIETLRCLFHIVRPHLTEDR